MAVDTKQADNGSTSSRGDKPDSQQTPSKPEGSVQLQKLVMDAVTLAHWPPGSVYVLIALALAIVLVPWYASFWAETVLCGAAATAGSMWVYGRKSKNVHSQQSATQKDRDWLPTFVAVILLLLLLASLWSLTIASTSWWMLLALSIIVVLSAVLYWRDHPYAMGRVLGGITVGALLLSAFMLRMWLDLHLWQTTDPNGVKFGELDETYRVEFPQRILIGPGNTGISISKASPHWGQEASSRSFGTYVHSPLPVPSPAGASELTNTLPANRTILAVVEVSPTMALRVSPPSFNVSTKGTIKATSVFTTALVHNLQPLSCEQVAGAAEEFALWVDVMLGNRCRWEPGTLTVTLAAAQIGPRLPISATTELETLHAGRLRQFITSNAVTQSPLLFFVPSLFAVLAYVANQSYVKEREDTRKAEDRKQEEARQADDAIKLYIDNLRKAQKSEASANFAQISRSQASGLVPEDQWGRLTYWNMLQAEPLPPRNALDWERFVDALNADCKATCGALQLRQPDPSDKFPWSTYSAMVEYVCDPSHGFHTDCSALINLYNEIKKKRETIEPEAFRSPWTKVIQLERYKSSSKSNLALFAEMDNYNPFRFTHAEEEPGALAVGGLFWPEHPGRDYLERLAAPVVVFGIQGSGKSALSFYLRSDYLQHADNRIFAVRMPCLLDDRSTLTYIAQDALKIGLANISLLSRLEGHSTLLARFLVEMLGTEKILASIAEAQSSSAVKTANSQHDPTSWISSFYSELESRARASANLGQVLAPRSWFSKLNELAHALGCAGCTLLIDNVGSPLTPDEFPFLFDAQADGTTLVLFTADLDCCEQLTQAGFPSLHLRWTPEQLSKAASYRLNYLRAQPNSNSGNAPLLDLTVFRDSFFDPKAWELLCTAQATPRRWFELLSYLREHSSASPAGMIDLQLMTQAIHEC